MKKILCVIKHVKSVLQSFIMNNSPQLDSVLKIDGAPMKTLFENNQYGNGHIPNILIKHRQSFLVC